MEKLYKVFIEGAYSGSAYHKMFTSWGYVITESPEEADLVLFTGGADVDPYLYGEEKHPTTMYSAERDKVCLELFELCIQRSIPMAGICRGSQFLCVANGGRLWQNVDGHLGNHMATDISGETFEVTSTHHQMMRPSGVNGIDHLVLLTASESTTKWSMDNTIGLEAPVSDSMDVEAVVWKGTKSFGYQPHPEMRGAPQRCTEWFMSHVKLLLEN